MSSTSDVNTPPVVIPASGNNIIINPSQVLYCSIEDHDACTDKIFHQRGNPVLECIRNVGKEYGDIVADYQVGRTTGVLFLRFASFSCLVWS